MYTEGAEAFFLRERRRTRQVQGAQDRAPLSWTNERADTLFVCERVRKAAASERDPRERSEPSNIARADANSKGRDDAEPFDEQEEGLRKGIVLRRLPDFGPVELLPYGTHNRE